MIPQLARQEFTINLSMLLNDILVRGRKGIQLVKRLRVRLDFFSLCSIMIYYCFTGVPWQCHQSLTDAS